MQRLLVSVRGQTRQLQRRSAVLISPISSARNLHWTHPTGVDVICVRGAACGGNGTDRFGKVWTDVVRKLLGK